MQFTRLTPEQKRQFDDEGYLIVRNALSSEEVAALTAAGDALIGSSTSENRQPHPSGLYDSFRNCIAMDPTFLMLLQHPRTFPLIVELFGPNIHLITSHLIYKLPSPPGTASDTALLGWHRDIAGTVHDLGHARIPRMEMKCAFYLTDMMQPSTGVTLFAPGSNHLKEPLQIPSGQSRPDGAVEPQLRAGDAVFFENRTFHAASVNLSGATAKMVMMGYGFRWLMPLDYTEQPSHVVERVDDIGKQLLNGLRDPEGRFIPGGNNAPLREWCRQHSITYTAYDY
ncbi:MAG: phytanoyl-CoA dioxygenase family protein [Armatimonadota bacterium]